MWNSRIDLYKSMTPPLRPDVSEVELLKDTITQLRASRCGQPLHVLLLGLTQEYLLMDWPEDVDLKVIDRSELMISHFWPGDIAGKRQLVRADWLSMPFADSTFDLIIGDGVFNLMSYPDGFGRFAHVLTQKLRTGGMLWVRVFTQSSPPEKPEALICEYGRSDSIHYFEFRYRLACSLQEVLPGGFDGTKETLDRYMVDQGISLSELYRKSSFTPPEIPPQVNVPKDLNPVFYPTREQFSDLLADHFSTISISHGTHTLARRTPVFCAS